MVKWICDNCCTKDVPVSPCRLDDGLDEENRPIRCPCHDLKSDWIKEV